MSRVFLKPEFPESPARTGIALVVKILFWLFNFGMLGLASTLYLEIADNSATTNDAALGCLIVKAILVVVLIFWGLGSLILGTLMIFTKPTTENDYNPKSELVYNPTKINPKTFEKPSEKSFKFLSLGYYILAGLITIQNFAAILPIFMKFVAIVATSDNKLETAMQFLCLFGIAIIPMVIFFMIFIFIAICLFHAGQLLAKQKNHSRCLVLVSLSCLVIPLGTILGLISLIVLSSESNRQLFARNEIT